MRRILVFMLLAAMLLPTSTAAQLHDYEAGQTVVVVIAVEMREQPTINAGRVITVLKGDLLVILDGTPVQAQGLTWWNVQTIEGSDSGWIPDSAFASQESVATATQTSDPASDNSADECWSSGDVLVDGGFPGWSVPPAMVIDPAEQYVATISTTQGEIVIELDAANAPIATNNFVCLAEAGYFDGADFHRIADGMFIQGGDPTGTGAGTPGYVLPSDPTTGEYPAGAIALANAQPDQNGAQFFIAATELTGEIPSDYPVFGHVVSGIGVVIGISHGEVETNPRGELSQPVDPVTITSVEIAVRSPEIGPPIRPLSPTATAIPQTTATVAVAPTVAMPPTEVAEEIELDAKDIAFEPTTITIEASDEPVTIHMKNTGAAPHNFSIDALDIDVDVAPGETVDIVIPAGTAPGTYDFYCNVPGHTEAGMVGTLIVEGSSDSSTSRSDTPGTSSTDAAAPFGDSADCEGLTEYQEALDLAYLYATLDNPDAARIFIGLDEAADDEEAFNNLTPADYLTVGAFFTSVADQMELIDPPTYAVEWHQAQIDSYRLTAEFLEAASTQGAELAAILFDSRYQDLEASALAALDNAGACPAFVTWATEEGL